MKICWLEYIRTKNLAKTYHREPMIRKQEIAIKSLGKTNNMIQVLVFFGSKKEEEEEEEGVEKIK